MHTSYSDITSKINEHPQWWDEHAVPRYCDFKPMNTADIYARQVALVEIACQACKTPFRVCFSWGPMDMVRTGKIIEDFTPETIKEIHYGDPPNYGCCLSGPTMNSIPIKVLEFWRMGGDEYTKIDESGMRVCIESYFDWRRIPELEIDIYPDWAKGDKP